MYWTAHTGDLASKGAVVFFYDFFAEYIDGTTGLSDCDDVMGVYLTFG